LLLLLHCELHRVAAAAVWLHQQLQCAYKKTSTAKQTEQHK
jgi:hypothetical protein